jgi:pimeloyl-ACP methyl ester carboxylesterase
VPIESVADLLAERSTPTQPRWSVPVVFVHGLWAGAWLFDAWLPFASDRGWDAWAPNLRGRAGSRPVPDLGRVTMQEFARDLLDVLEATGPAVIVGYSMGGLLTQMVASDPRVRAMILLCSVPPRGIVALSPAVARRTPRYVPAMVRGGPLRPTRRDAGEILMNAMTPAERDRWYPRLIADSGTAARQMAMGSISADPAAISCRSLVVSAEHDRISPPSVQPKLISRYRAQHAEVGGHGHLIAVEDGWEATAGTILDWAGERLARDADQGPRAPG